KSRNHHGLYHATFPAERPRPERRRRVHHSRNSGGQARRSNGVAGRGPLVVTLISRTKESAPADLDGFREFARSLPSSDIYDVIRDAEPLGEAATARFPANIRRRYEKLS